VSVRIEPARPGDAAEIAAILSDWMHETPWLPDIHGPEEHRIFGLFLLERTHVTVARRGRRVVGFLARRGSQIEALYVARAERGKGFGQRLLAYARRGRRQLWLWTHQANTGARRFYARNGLVETEVSDGLHNDERLPDVKLMWSKP